MSFQVPTEFSSKKPKRPYCDWVTIYDHVTTIISETLSSSSLSPSMAFEQDHSSSLEDDDEDEKPETELLLRQLSFISALRPLASTDRPRPPRNSFTYWIPITSVCYLRNELIESDEFQDLAESSGAKVSDSGIVETYENDDEALDAFDNGVTVSFRFQS